MGRTADCTIDNKSFWFRQHAKTFFGMCFKNESFDIAIWTTDSKQNTTRVLKQLVSETLQDQFVFTWTASGCKQQKGQKAIDNPTKVVNTKQLKRVWTKYSQYDATNTLLVDSAERVEKNSKENLILATTFDGKNQDDKWLITDLLILINKLCMAPDVRDILKNFQ